MSFDKFKKFICKTQPTYMVGDFKIVLKSIYHDVILLDHYGWTCPSMYNDSPSHSGCGTQIFRSEKLEFECTEDNYSEQTYLIFRVSDDFQSITIKYDHYGRKGLVLSLTQQ